MIIVLQPVDGSRDAVFNQHHLEVDQQAKPFVGGPEIGQKLLLGDWEEHLDAFDFRDDLNFDDQIGPESGIDEDILSRPNSYAKTAWQAESSSIARPKLYCPGSEVPVPPWTPRSLCGPEGLMDAPSNLPGDWVHKAAAAATSKNKQRDITIYSGSNPDP